MIEFKADLPQGALLGSERDRLASVLAGGRAIWLQGRAERFDRDSYGVVTHWHAVTPVGRMSAVPVTPNEGNTRLRDTARCGMICESKTNCGLVLTDAVENAAHWTAAVIYTPGDPMGDTSSTAQTLLTVNTATTGHNSSGTYLFVSDQAEGIVARDTADALEIVTPAVSVPLGRARMLVLTLSGKDLALAQGIGAPIHITGGNPGMACPADIFIGCRSHRNGLRKTLGQSILHDVIFWPGQTLLLPRSDSDMRQLQALRQYYLWAD
jgi:hypothetical protein